MHSVDEKISLACNPITNKEIDELCEWLKKYPRLTKGGVTVAYEAAWSQYLGCKHSVFVNSGSSANLLMLYTLMMSKEIKPGDKVVVPALSWATDLAPVIQLGLEPILCDCNLKDLSIDVNHFTKIINEERPKALMLVSVMGLCPDMMEITSLCTHNDILLLEDTCESLGSADGTMKLGTFGQMSSFSTYYGHHLSTIEGGMVCTDDPEYYDLLLMLRSHGWSRDLSPKKQKQLADQWGGSDFQNMFAFYVPGFNLRSTDLQAFIGLQQLEKVEDVVQGRWEAYTEYRRKFKAAGMWVPEPSANSINSSMGYPLLVTNRDEIVAKLQASDIECRPIICGSMANQPMYRERYGTAEVENSKIVDDKGLYIPSHDGLTINEIEHVVDVILSI